jgi:hypothetical protein
MPGPGARTRAIRISGNNEKGEMPMAFLTFASVNSPVEPRTEGGTRRHSWFRRFSDAYAAAQMRQAERGIRRFCHLHAIAWSADMDR